MSMFHHTEESKPDDSPRRLADFFCILISYQYLSLKLYKSLLDSEEAPIDSLLIVI